MARGNDRGLYEKEPGSGVWWIRYADADGSIKRQMCGEKSHARTVYQERKREVRMQRQLPELAAAKRAASVTFKQIADDALAYCRRHADFSSDEERMTRMCEWWAKMPASSLTPQEIERRLSSMTVRGFRGKDAKPKPVSGATINRYRALLSLTFRLAQKNGQVAQGFNPARSVELRKEVPRVRWMSADEELKLRKVLQRDYPERVAILDLALNTGLRWSDQARLTAEHREGDAVRVVIGKTGVPLGVKLNGIAGEAFGQLAERAQDGGQLIGEKSARGWFNAAVKKAGIADLHWHDLRHTFATRLLLAGVPAQQVQKLLGHATITMTLRYAHVVAGFEDDALAKLESMNRHCATGGAPVTQIAETREKKSPRGVAMARRREATA